MAEVVVVVTLQAQPGKEEETRQALTAGTATTHAEDGCLRYAIHQGVEDPASFAILECWSSQAHLDAHLQSPHVQALLGKMETLLAAPAIIGVFGALPGGDPAKGTLSA